MWLIHKWLQTNENVLTATEIAISDSVTVSMGEETSGAFKVIFLVRADVRSCDETNQNKWQWKNIFKK